MFNEDHHLRLLLLLNLLRDLLLLLHVDILLQSFLFVVESFLIHSQDLVADVDWRFEEVPVDIFQFVSTAVVDVTEQNPGVFFENVQEFILVPVSDVSEVDLEIEQHVVDDLAATHQLVLELSRRLLAVAPLVTVDPAQLEHPEVPNEFDVHHAVLQRVLDVEEGLFVQGWAVDIGENVGWQGQVGHRRDRALIQLVVWIVAGGGHGEVDLAGSVALFPRLLDS